MISEIQPIEANKEEECELSARKGATEQQNEIDRSSACKNNNTDQ
jgi:hypothetical protein